MKRIFVIAMLAALLLALTACGEEPQTVYTVAKQGKVFTVDTVNCTVSDGAYTYSYSVTGGKTTISYPNDATYYWSWSGNVGYGGWSEDYDDSTYTDGSTLMDVISAAQPAKRERSGNPLLGLLLIGLGLWNVISPRSSWYLSYGWRFRDAEPSEAALGMNVMGGVIGIIFGVIMLFV